MRILSLLLSVILVLGIVSCAETKISQCNRMNRVVNRISALPRPQNAQEWLQLGNQMATIGAELRGITLQDPVLVSAQQRLVELTNEASQSATDLGQALQTQNNNERNQAITRIEQILQREAPIINEINQHCSN